MSISISDESDRDRHAGSLGLRPLTVSVKTARRLLGIGNTLMLDLIRTKRVETISIGRRRLVIFASLEALLARRKT
jgi:hypothetical protein